MSLPVEFLVQTLNSMKSQGFDFNQFLDPEGDVDHLGDGRQNGHNHEETECSKGTCGKCNVEV